MAPVLGLFRLRAIDRFGRRVALDGPLQDRPNRDEIVVLDRALELGQLVLELRERQPGLGVLHDARMLGAGGVLADQKLLVELLALA